ncbi:MAG TPA: maleylpyruvate isomerase family mycothiol-dependent enzyme [Actinomycetota bacterium]|nr:maleylpyruvate isomerase family mycothiol-dependent enzyme [Actinomycetota bacterium]
MSIADQDTSQWDATNFAAKDNLLRVVREEAEGFFALAEKPENWDSPTPAGHWRVRNLVAHIADTTEGYLERFETTRAGGTAEPLAPLDQMAVTADKRAQALSGAPQDEQMARLREDFSRAMKVFEEVNEQDWSNFLITHAYMGPVPAFFYPIGQLMDYGVHGWDLREGLGLSHFLSSDAADLLVPFMFVLWQATTDVSRLGDESLQVGVRVSGRNAGTYRVTVTGEGMAYEPGSADDLPVLIDFDPASLVLTAFGRTCSGTPYGDLDAARKFAGLFFRI